MSGRDVLLIGGGGFFGSATRRALLSACGTDLAVASRAPGPAGTVELDLTRPATFASFRGFRCVVNCASTDSSPPDAAIAFCHDAGIPFIETSADPRVIARLLQGGHTGGRGALVLGMGLFPGLSNIVAADAYRQCAPAARLAIAVRISPLSGAGGAMRQLMLRYLSESDTSGASTVSLPFVSGTHAGIPLPMPEVAMLQASLGVGDVRAYLALAPSVFTRAVAAWTRISRSPVARAAEPIASAGLHLVRGMALRRRDAAAELSGIATGTRTCTVMLRTPHAIETGAWVVAAAVRRVLSAPLAPRVYRPEELFALDDLLTELGRLGAVRPHVVRQP